MAIKFYEKREREFMNKLKFSDFVQNKINYQNPLEVDGV